MIEPSEKESSSRSFSRELMGNDPWAIGSKFILFVVYATASVIIVRGLGKESYGIYRLCTNIGEYLLFVCCLGHIIMAVGISVYRRPERRRSVRGSMETGRVFPAYRVNSFAELGRNNCA